jgi:ankyrin repeat protein
MRLLKVGEDGGISLVQFEPRETPQYTILSHTWGADGDEVTFKDMMKGRAEAKPGYAKIQFCAEQTTTNGFQYFWIDTCCIDKSSSAELTESINSMFCYYQDAARCYVYLTDVSVSGDGGSGESWEVQFGRTRWLRRGWTLQELIAPSSVEFFSKERTKLGDKRSLEQLLSEVINIPAGVLRGTSDLDTFGIEERIAWTTGRDTKRDEDMAYCLLGLFDIQMPLLYGEGRAKATRRLRKAIAEDGTFEPCGDSGEAPISRPKKRRRLDSIPGVSDLKLSRKIKLALLQSLWFEQLGNRQNHISDAYHSTCSWLLETPEYQDWLDISKTNDHGGFLWIKGKPGAGKSTIMRFVHDHAHRSLKDATILTFFFHARGSHLEKSTEGAYRALLWQLLKHFPMLRSVFDFTDLPVLAMGENLSWTIGALKRLLRKVIERLTGRPPLLIFIDALDECDEQEIREMISFFEQISEIIISNRIRLQVCFSSRHYPHTTMRRSINLIVEKHDEHDHDIMRYIRGALNIGQGAMVETIRSELHQKANGIFMWVVLVVRILNKEYDRGRAHTLRRRLHDTPGDLHELFRDILARDKHSKNDLLLCLQLVLFARTRLDAADLYRAILVGTDSAFDFSETEDDRTMSLFIIDCSKGLVEMDSLGRPQFIHESVRDFLLKEDFMEQVLQNTEFSVRAQGEEAIKCCCFKLLKLLPLDYIREPDSRSPFRSNNAFNPCLSNLGTQLSPSSKPCSFLTYATENVLHHAEEAAAGGICQRDCLLGFPTTTWISASKSFPRPNALKDKFQLDLLYVLATKGQFPHLISAHPSSVSCSDINLAFGQSPFLGAVERDLEENIKAFLIALASTSSCQSRLADLYLVVDSLDMSSPFEPRKVWCRWDTLCALANLGNADLFKFFLDTAKNDVNARVDTDGRTPLIIAAARNHLSIVQHLLRNPNVDVNATDTHGGSALYWGVQSGNDYIVRLLLATKKVNVNARVNTPGRQTPLMVAVKNCDYTIVQQLVGVPGINVNSKEYHQMFFSAVGRGDMSTVKALLLTKTIDVNSRNNFGETPLTVAVKRRYKTVIEVLLGAKDIDVNAENSDGESPVWIARRRNYDSWGILNLLLQRQGGD